MKERKIMRVNHKIRRLNRRELPILFVRSSCKHFYAQMFEGNRVLFDVSTLNNTFAAADVKSYNTKGVIELAEVCASKIRELNIQEYVFNRGAKEYIGKIKIFGDTVRSKLGGKNE